MTRYAGQSFEEPAPAPGVPLPLLKVNSALSRFSSHKILTTHSFAHFDNSDLLSFSPNMIQKSASKLRGALIASPFVGLSILCLIAIDTPKMMRHQQPYLESRKIEWSGGSIPINPRFHYVGFLDEMWRGTTVTFSPSTLGYDRISSWQMFSFLNDLGPLYATWFLESSRPGNAGSPAYL
jgi:hypothetical protein